MASSDGNTLPVTEARKEIVKMIKRSLAVIIVGETGSGKTTQIPQYVYDDIISRLPEGQRGLVGCTQPRRVAAVSVARHVARQRKTKLGQEVAYAVRFDDTTTKDTKIKFLTDGILLREIQADPDIKHYSCIILDEAHERTLHGDVLFGLLKNIARRRKGDLKIVVMSATLNTDQFSNFWWNAPIGVVHGRTFPVTIMHTVEPQADYVEAAVSTILQIHETEDPGDILCFLTGQEEIEDSKRILEQRMKLFPNHVPDFLVLTLYSAMPYEQQLAIFDPSPNGLRKVILATNIAETSITVEGIKYVVDSGVVKAKYFNTKTGMEILSEVDISQAQATQRAGRAGRMAAGKCFRLYTASAFESLQENTIPEIQRSSLISVVLQMKAIGIDSVLNFEFMDAPNPKAVLKAEETLMVLRGLDKNSTITELGKRLTDFPIEPMFAIVLLAAKAMKIGSEAAIVVAMTSTENIFLTSRETKEAADRCRAVFSKSSGDHATLLSLYSAYKASPKSERQTWCESNGLSYRQMQKAEDVIVQLLAILHEKDDKALLAKLVPKDLLLLTDENGDGAANSKSTKRPRSFHQEEFNEMPLRANHNDSLKQSGRGSISNSNYELLRRALCFGLFVNTAFFNAKLGFYQTIIGQQPVYIHPSSVLFTHRRKPALVIYNSVVRTTKRYMKDVSVIYEEWLQESAPDFFIAAS